MLELNLRSALLLAFTLLPISWIGAQTADLISVRSLSQIQGLASNLSIPNGVLPLDFGVAKYRVTYPMDYLGVTYNVTGALFVPVDGEGNALTCALPTHRDSVKLEWCQTQSLSGVGLAHAAAVPPRLHHSVNI